MARFTKQQMLDELRTIFLFEADHILLGAGEAVAKAFIGFGAGEAGEFCHRPSADVDLSRFQISTSFDRGYEYAFRPSILNSLGEGEVQDLSVFMLGTPKAGGIQSGGETHDFMTQNGLCQIIADTVHARWKLEWETPGVHDFTTRELALLADMTEGAVRNALADKSDSGLVAIPGTKNPVMIEHAEAMRWLKGRRGFISSPERASEDRFLAEQLQNVQSAAALGHLIALRVRQVFGALDNASAKLGLQPTVLEAWSNGSQDFNEAQALQIACALDFETPLFVGKALEVTLRRSMPQRTGEKS